MHLKTLQKIYCKKYHH